MFADHSNVTPDRVHQLVEGAVAEGDAMLDAVARLDGERTFENTLLPFDRVDALHNDTYGKGPFMARVHPDREVRKAASAAEAELDQWASSIAFRRDLYEAVQAYAATDEAAALDGERARLLDRLQRDFRRAGHQLAPEARAELEQLNDRLIELSVAFGTNLDEASDHIEVTRDDLDGMPDAWIDRLSPGSEEGTFRVTLDYPDYLPFTEQAHRRDLREQLTFKFANRAREENTPILQEALRIRRRIASLFDLASWADHALEVKMAADLDTLEEFYGALVPALQAKAQEEQADLEAAHDHGRVERWDFRYLHTRIKRERFGIDQNEVAEYFPLQQVLDGMFAITQEVFGLSYRQLDGVPVWHADVSTWEVSDAGDGRVLGHFHLDLHPREGKFGHAAVFPLQRARHHDEGPLAPVVAMVCNFTRPTGSSPSLLQHEEVTTLFHEFGHVLHGVLGHTQLHRFAGTGVERDFVEAPSQIMEHWCWTPHVLQRFARHHETGQPIPAELVEQLVAARDLHVAKLTLRQVELGRLDLAYHGPDEHDDLVQVHNDVIRSVGFQDPHDGTFFPAGWGHLFGYDAGYYGYLWAKVFGDDMFSRFQEEGELDRAVGMDYRRKVLERGGSVDAGQMLRDFLGRQPNREAFLRNLGIQPATP